ncbi:MAG TPA: outer membrane beta-barrel protein [Micropepsaceae bacterium]|nr:outer membrane beta-barrel protein [Micropepsaceae bacterium]
MTRGLKNRTAMALVLAAAAPMTLVFARAVDAQTVTGGAETSANSGYVTMSAPRIDPLGDIGPSLVPQGFEPVGARVGSFMFFPQIEVTGTFDDNIYATNTAGEDDFITRYMAGAVMQSTWADDELHFGGAYVYSDYADNEDESASDAGLIGGGAFRLGTSTTFAFEGTYQWLTEDRASNDLPGFQAEPTDVELFDVWATLTHRFNRLTAAVGAGFQSADYDDVPLFGGGTLDMDERDRQKTTWMGYLGYELTPGYSFYLRGSLYDIDYDLQPPAVFFNRDSEGYEVLAGISFELTRLVNGHVAIGFFEQDYDFAGFGTVDGLDFSANLTWEASERTRVVLDGSRSVEETQLLFSSSYVRTRFGIGVVHALYPNINISAGVARTDDDYESIFGFARDDQGWDVNAGAVWFINRNLSANFDFRYTDRDSNTVLFEFERTRVGGGLTIRF